MSKKAIAAAGLALLTTIAAANGADIPGGYRPYAAPKPAYAAYNWMGFYIGGNTGYQWGSITQDTTSPSGSALGLQAGYNWQNGAAVFGVETDIQWSNAEDSAKSREFSNIWFGTTRGRLGYAMNNFLIYATGGFAYGELELINSGRSDSRVHLGWTLGMGAEVGLTPNWTARVEYLYFDLADRNFANGSSHGFESSLLRGGVNYKF